MFDLPQQKAVALKSWRYKIKNKKHCLFCNTFGDLQYSLRLTLQQNGFVKKKKLSILHVGAEGASSERSSSLLFVKAAVAVNNPNAFPTATLNVKSALGRTYSLVKCTPPFRPLSNTPLPLPPARICAFSTISLASGRKRQKKKVRERDEGHGQQPG